MKKILLVGLFITLAGVAFAETKPQKDWLQLAAENSARGAKLAEVAPWMKDFGNFAAATKKTKVLSTKDCELIAIALSIQAKCEGCIMAHVRNAINAGVTREELVDSLGESVVMGGGPASSYAGLVLDAYDVFKAAADKK